MSLHSTLATTAASTEERTTSGLNAAFDGLEKLVVRGNAVAARLPLVGGLVDKTHGFTTTALSTQRDLALKVTRAPYAAQTRLFDGLGSARSKVSTTV